MFKDLPAISSAPLNAGLEIPLTGGHNSAP